MKFLIETILVFFAVVVITLVLWLIALALGPSEENISLSLQPRIMLKEEMSTDRLLKEMSLCWSELQRRGFTNVLLERGNLALNDTNGWTMTWIPGNDIR